MLPNPTRSWGTRFDTLPTSPSPTTSPSVKGVSSSPSSIPHHLAHSPTSTSNDDRHPHDASVFVGSLPTNIDLDDLTHMLGDHLSDYVHVKNIKVVRDSKGGVCAFVQCEDALAATKLIDTLNHAKQKLFFGRILRYEPARAFRSLLFSYRTPFGSRPPSVAAKDELPRRTEDVSLELDLPFAMCLFKNPYSRFYAITYNNDAIEAEKRATSEQEDSKKLFYQPVVFNEKSLYEIATFFGRLEKFCALDIPPDLKGDPNEPWSQYPPPHNAPRSPGMDKSCWEIKWEHRDDCLSALNTLRRVPHITVTWAHQPTHFNLNYRRSSSLYHMSSHLLTSHNYPSRPHTFLAKTPWKYGYFSPKEGGPGGETEVNPSHDEVERKNASSPTPITRVKWNESDFPPLGTTLQRPKTSHVLWYKDFQDNGHHHGSTFQVDNGTKSPSVPSLSDLRYSSQRMSSLSTDKEFSVMNPTGLDKSFPSRNSVPPFHRTPTSVYSDGDRFPYRRYGDAATDHEFDPTTIFVGGLEMYGPRAWDEEKLRAVFSKFGGLENVQLVKPGNSPVAFAFVKFDNKESPARAVAEEHNRVYDDRPIRVQLKDCNLRSSWRYGRGRPHSRFHYNSDTSHNSHISGIEVVGTSDEAPHIPNEEPPAEVSQGNTSEKDVTNLKASSDSAAECPSRSISESVESSCEEKNEVQSSNPEEEIQESPPSPHERQENCEVGLTPSLSPAISAESSTHGPALATPPPYSYGAGGVNYYPAPWAQPYLAAPYHLPYYGAYPSYASQAHYSEVDSSSPNMPPLAQGGTYTAYIPYSSHIARTQSIDQSHQHRHGEPPVVPTGFIQNEQGTLIAVYQTDALDRYMSMNRNGIPGTQPGTTQAPVWSAHPQHTPTSFPPSVPGQGPVPVGGRPVVSGNNVSWAHVPSHMYYPASSFPYFPPAPMHSQAYPGVCPSSHRGRSSRGDRTDGGHRHRGNRPSGGRQSRAHTRPSIRGSLGGPHTVHTAYSSTPNYWDGSM